MKSYTKLAVLALFSMSAFTSPAMADNSSNDTGYYKITITNLTRGSLFTPALAVSHKKGVSVFTEGAPASEALAQLAEGGATQPLENALIATGKVHATATLSVPVLSGQSVSLNVATKKRANYISMASMILPTNDGFIALNGVKGPGKGKTKVVYIPAYDAGSELNDEFCVNIPGPHCGGDGYSVNDGEGYVHIHAGIHGGADLNAADYDWRNPVAKVTIEHVK